MSKPVHRGAVCKLSVRWIYYCGMNKSTGLKTSKSHLCAVPKSSSKSLLANPTKKPSFQIINNSSFTISTHYNIFTRNKMNGLLRVSSNNIWADWESEMSQPVHRGAVWKFSLQWIYYCGMNKSTRLKTSKPHLCAVPKSSSKSLLANLTNKPQFQNIHNSFFTFVLITTFLQETKWMVF